MVPVISSAVGSSRFRVFLKAAVDEPLLKHQERATEWLSSFWMLCWAGALASKGDTFSMPGYREFAREGFDESATALAFAIIGSMRIVALIINGAWPRSPLIRLIGASAGITMWGIVAILTYISTYRVLGIATPGPPCYAVLVAFEVLSAYRSTLDVRYRR